MVDPVLLEEVLTHIHNWFVRETVEVEACGIEGGALPTELTDKMLDGQWYRVQGSYLNDGLHLNPDDTLLDETFSGTVSLLAVPRPLLVVVEDIAAWQDANGSVSDGPYASESFGGYTYTLKTSNGAQNGPQGLSGWRLAFADRLNPWRKIS